ncbi:MAG: DUF1211 domain-containing protein [Ignavibacteriae bacterium]|nr:DUF1211 domain-containing protein [Ignavibacteriota bacterium]MCB9244122.1 DUF1211 domain-containing protein [Ignavibacteriales bacterium]
MAEKETTRVEAFSDGVFAIAITLLVLGLVEPHIEATTTNEELFKGLWHIWPSYLGFIISFTTILIMWINHHEIFRIVGTVNKKFLISNGVLLMMVTFINFPTKVFSSQLQTDSAVAATAFLMGSYVLVAAAFLWWWQEAKKLRKNNVPDEVISKISRSYALGVPSYMICLILAFIWIPLSIAIFAVMSIFWITFLRVPIYQPPKHTN